MKKPLLVVLLASLAASAQQPVDIIRVGSIKAHTFFLTADEMRGRKAGSPESRIAVNYIAAEFMRLGLKPVGDNDTYFQNFGLVRAWTDEENISLIARIDGHEKSYQLDHDFYLSWIQSANSAEAVGPLAFVGYGIKAPEYGYNDFADVNLRGKVAMVLAHEPQEFDSNSKFKGKWNTIHAYEWLKVEQVRKAGAAALLIVLEPPEFPVSKFSLFTPHRPPRIPSAPTDYEQPGPKYALPGRLWDLPVFTITRVVANELLAGTDKTIESLQQSIDLGLMPQSFEVPGVMVKAKKTFKDRHVLQGRNVLGLLEGSDPALKDEVLVITGHHDHGGIVGGRIYRGADDDASGTIGVLEIAKAYVAGKVRPKRSLLFVAFDAEELGLLGAFYYVEHPAAPLQKTVANLNMDMIGRDEESATWQTTADQNRNAVNIVGTLYNSELRRIIESSNKTIGLKLDFKTDTKDPEEWFARSDHFAFAIKSIPMVLFNTGEHPDYHTENDTWDRINYGKMEKIIRLIFLTSLELANSDRKLSFTP